MDYDELFGKKSSGQYIKWANVNEALYMQVTGAPDPRYPDYDFKSGKRKFLVKLADAPKYKPMQEGDFDPESDEVENSFPLTVIRVPVKVFRRVLADGQDDPTFEEFESFWIPTQNQTDKLKDQMLETRIPLAPGTVVAVKYLEDGKPRKYMVRLAAGE